MQLVTDQTFQQVPLLRGLPLRIVSLVPSQTELLFDLGLNEEVVGLTRYCVHPASKARTKTVVGGTKDPDLQLIRSLQPSLILGNKEENTREVIEQLREEFPVWLSDVSTLADATAMIRTVSEVVGKPETGTWLVNKINERFLLLSGEVARQQQEQPTPPRRVAYLIWRKPWMVAGSGTFIHSLLETTGWVNAFADVPRYPTVSPDEFRQRNPDLVLLSSEPYPFRAKHQAELNQLLPRATVRLVEGDLFSWYGSRLLRTPDYLRSLRASL
jgi:ABC-type Fe3+-hydroxamate transport system substrate-binding protein